MVCRGTDERTKNRGTFLQKHNELSPIVTRFFKIMFGKDYSKVLYLPPKFARTVNHLVNQEIQIEDSSGLRWSVTLSNVKGSLAFYKGWQKFSLDHHLKEGQLLVFNYRKGSHFVVRIFGRSACEKINFDNQMPQHNKRSRRDQGTPEDEPFQTVDVNSGNKLISATSVASGSELQNHQTNLEVANGEFGRMQLLPISTNMEMEDPTFMLNRDDGYYQGEDRKFLYDLSSFEMEIRAPGQESINAKLDPSNSGMMEYATEPVEALDIKVPVCHIGITEQTKTMGDDAQQGFVQACQIKGHCSDVFSDKLEKALDTKLAPSDTEKGFVQACQIKGRCSDIFSDKLEKSLDTKLAPSDTDIEEQTKMMDNAETSLIQTDQIKGHSGDIFTDKFEKALDTDTTPVYTETTKQTGKKGGDTQMAVLHSSQTAGRSGDIFKGKFHTKASDKSNLSKDMMDDVSNFPNGSSMIAEREHAVKSTCHESSFSSKRAIKKEQVELEDKANGLLQGSCGQEPSLAWNHGKMSSAVKVEPDLLHDIGPSVSIRPFSTEVKRMSYLELPVGLSIRQRRDKGQGRVICLRDSVGRLWPVYYAENKSAIKALTANWAQFCEQNNIKPGDKCRFQVEDDMQCIYRVYVNY